MSFIGKFLIIIYLARSSRILNKRTKKRFIERYIIILSCNKFNSKRIWNVFSEHQESAEKYLHRQRIYLPPLSLMLLTWH